MEGKQKICCFCEKWGSGGIESFLINTYEHMNLERFSIDIVVMKKESDFFTPKLKKLGISLIVLSQSTRTIFKNYLALKKLFRQKKYHVIHLNVYHDLSIMYLGAVPAESNPIKIIHAHGSGLRSSVFSCIKLLIHKIVRCFFPFSIAKNIACSKNASKFIFPQREQNHVQIIHNGIDINKFWGKNNFENERYHNKLVVCSVGRLSSEKNQTFMLDVIAELVFRKINVEYLLVGEGEMEDALKEKVNHLHIKDNVIFYGMCKDVPTLLQRTDVFVLPSIVEGLGIVAIEAQAAGIPTLCSMGVPEETVPTVLGYRLSLQEGPKTWADKIEEMSHFPRTDVREILNDKGYNINSTAEIMTRIYGGV